MKKYTFFFVLDNNTLDFKNVEDLEKSICGEKGYNILSEKCKDVKIVDLPEEITEYQVVSMAYALLVGKMNDAGINFQSPSANYCQCWIWDHNSQIFI